jgi:UDP-N-acetyl-D-mannosaminuronate dehydrogenase
VKRRSRHRGPVEPGTLWVFTGGVKKFSLMFLWFLHALCSMPFASSSKDVDDDRESPTYKIMGILQDKGAEISYNDPHIPKLHAVRKYDFDLSSTKLSVENLSAADCVLVSTDHSVYDYDFILEHARLIVDTRNVFAGKNTRKKVFMA